MTKQRMAALIVPAVVFLSLLMPLRGGFTDDGYIHIQYAKNLIDHGEYSFNRGEVSFGTTSPLWVMIVASFGRVFGSGENLVVISRVLSWLAGLAAVLLMFMFARALRLGPWVAWLCALALAVHAWHVRWAALSMETSSSVLAMAAIGIVSVNAYRSDIRALSTGFFMALATLLRPEVYLLPPVYLLAMLLVGRERRWVCVVKTFAVYALLIVPWLLFAKFHLGQFVPNTAAAKRGPFTLSPSVVVDRLEPILKISLSTEGLFVILIFAAALALRRRTRVFAPDCRFLLLWIVALPAAYVVLDVQVLSRYMLLTTPFTIVLGFVALDDILSRSGGSTRAKRTVLAVVAAIVVVSNVGLYFGVALKPSRAFSHDLTHQLRALALHLKEHSDDDAVVAVTDIGYVAFYSDRRVLDLGGLVDTETNELRENNTYEEIVQKGLYLDLDGYPRVDFLLDRHPVPNRFHDKTINGYRLESMRTERVDNLGIRKPGPFYFSLYRLSPGA